MQINWNEVKSQLCYLKLLIVSIVIVGKSRLVRKLLLEGLCRMEQLGSESYHNFSALISIRNIIHIF